MSRFLNAAIILIASASAHAQIQMVWVVTQLEASDVTAVAVAVDGSGMSSVLSDAEVGQFDNDLVSSLFLFGPCS